MDRWWPIGRGGVVASTEAPLAGAVENEVKARGPVCTFCEEKLTPKQAFCGKCGHPTELANHEERVLWELGQWEVSRRNSANADPSAARAAESASRTRELFKSARVKTAEGADTGDAPPSGAAASAERRSFVSRFRQVAPPDAVPAGPSAKSRSATTPPTRGRSTDDASRVPQTRSTQRTQPQPPARTVDRPAPAQPAARSRPAPSRPAPSREAPAPRPAARPAASAPPAPAPARSAASARAVTTPERPVARPPAAAKTVTSTRPAPATKPSAPARPAAPRASAAPAPVVEQPQAAPVQPREDSPFIVVRKAPEAGPPTQAPPKATPPKAQPAKPAAVHAPPKPSRADRKADEAQRREAERAEKERAKEAARLAKERAKEAEQRRVQAARDEERRRKEQAKEASKRERKHRRHSKRVKRRVVSLDLRNGERVSLSIEGWSRFRRATLVVTNYRVALITRVPPQVRWIPLEEVATVRRRWRGVHSLVISCPIEVLSLQKRKRQMLASFEQLLSSEVAEARTVGSVRHHADITQEYSDRATEIWDSRFHRLRLWIRRHPAATAAAGILCVAATLFLLSFLTSAFSPVR